MTFYGENREDRLAHQFLRRYPESELNRTFLDIGAYDGVHFSNTLLFEELGWRGICVEADQQAFQALRQNRKCTCLNLACSERKGKVDFYTEADRPMGTTSAVAAEKLKEGWQFRSDEKRRVPAATVDNILQTHGLPQVDFVSIDVDGGEVEVLRGFDLSRARPRLICIETNLEQVKAGKWPREHVEEIDRIITSYGYYRLKVHGANSFYARDQLPWLERLWLQLRNRD